MAFRVPQDRQQPLSTPHGEEKLLPQNCEAVMALRAQPAAIKFV
jgi:hypothetical protein